MLSDKTKRYIYDTKGLEGLEEHQKMSSMGQYGMGMRTGPNYQFEMPVTLEELYNGAVKQHKINKNVICEHCSGSGARDGEMKKCDKCGGKGSVIENVRVGMGFTMRMENQCNKCAGKGKMIGTKCPYCQARKVVQTQQKYDVQIEQGMTHGQSITFEGESEQHPDYLPGDIIFYLREENHHRFKREQNDLHTSMTLTMKEALLGFNKSIQHMDGRHVTVSSDEPVQPNQVLVIKEEGMPIHNTPAEKGDMRPRRCSSLV